MNIAFAFPISTSKHYEFSEFKHPPAGRTTLWIKGVEFFKVYEGLGSPLAFHGITPFVIVHRRVAEDAKRMNIFLSAERAERKKLSF